MTQPAPPRIILLEANPTLASRAIQILEDHGWQVHHHKDFKEALSLLESSKPTPFDLFISSFQLPDMAGDDVLKAVKNLSPLTRRMLLVPSDQAQLIIRAINKAEINACLVMPASDQDLVNQVRTCLASFKKSRKIEQFNRLTVHQNRQMFQIAQRLKKKDKLCQEQISEKNTEILVLQSRLKARSPEPLTLERRLSDHQIPTEPKALAKEFSNLAAHARSLFSEAAAKAGIPSPPAPQRFAPLPLEDASNPAQKMDPLIVQVIETLLAAPPGSHAASQADPALDQDQAPTISQVLEITLSEDRTQAFARLKSAITAPALLILGNVLNLLEEQGVCFGIADDEAIQAWLSAPQKDEPFCIAQGETPVPGKDGTVTYDFRVDYTNPGKIMADGRIDFRDRGNIPFVAKEDLLATKTAPVQGKNGMSVSGDVIHVPEALDPVFEAGSGTRLSEDGLSIFAAIDGQPHLDHLGTVSVNPELPIEGDVDFQTGNITFNGNIVVKGTVKQGFTVKGINLTAKEIEGATIDITGDLCVSDGITDAHIVSSGNIYAKFINNSKIMAFGNVAIQKEIIDSTLLLSGRCENNPGVILASTIAAKLGIDAGKVGTSASEPSKLKIGVNDHIEHLVKEIDDQLNASVDKLNEVRDKMKQAESKDRMLYGMITGKAQIQEMAQKEINALKPMILKLKQSNDATKLNQALVDYKAAELKLKKAEQELNAIFEIQDRFAKEIESYKGGMDRLEVGNKKLVLKKMGLREFAEKTQAEPRLTVARSITQGTIIQGPNVSHTLREDRKRCQIFEREQMVEGIYSWEMEVSDL